MPGIQGLFGNKKTAGPSAQEQQFDDEWYKAGRLYRVVAGFGTFNFNLRHPETKEIMTPHAALAGTFEDWQQIKSPWDRQRLLFSVFLDSVYKSMKPWQIANVLVVMREAQEALRVLAQSQTIPSNADDYPQYCAAYAKVRIAMGNENGALEWARKAFQALPNDRAIQLVLADSLRLTGDCDESEQIYSTLMAASEPDPTAEVTQMFAEMFDRETGRVPSPILAVTIGEMLKNPSDIEIFWNLGEAEYYDSPYFRMHHAYLLANQGQMQRCFAKLTFLVQEMPWLKEASLNLSILFQHLDPTGAKMMPEFQNQLRDTIKKNSWTTDGMYTIEIGKV